MSNDGSDDQREALIMKAWRHWILMFVPLFIASMEGFYVFGWGVMMPTLVGLLVVVLLNRRFVKGRNWRSIMWGAYASKD